MPLSNNNKNNNIIAKTIVFAIVALFTGGIVIWLSNLTFEDNTNDISKSNQNKTNRKTNSIDIKDKDKLIVQVTNTIEPNSKLKVFLDVEPDVASKIKCVTYYFPDSTLPVPKPICNATNNFEYTYGNAWGKVKVKVKILFKDKSSKELGYKLRF